MELASTVGGGSEKTPGGRMAQYVRKENEATYISFFASGWVTYEARVSVICILCIPFWPVMAPLDCLAPCLKKIVVRFRISLDSF